MVTLNILMILLSFINSLKKDTKKVDVAQEAVGMVVLSGGPGSGGIPC
jgi:hypothetical protein